MRVVHLPQPWPLQYEPHMESNLSRCLVDPSNLEIRLRKEHFMLSHRSLSAKCIKPVDEANGVLGAHTSYPADPRTVGRSYTDIDL